MAKAWKDVREAAVRAGRLNESSVAERRHKAVATVRAHRLAELRDSSGLNQTAVAEKLGVSQSRVSRIERGGVERAEVSTLRAFATAVGGELEIVVKMGDRHVRIA